MKMKLHGTSTPDREARALSTVPAAELSPQLVSRIDEALRALTGRNLVATTEVVDLLLDLRLQVTLDSALSELFDSRKVAIAPVSG